MVYFGGPGLLIQGNSQYSQRLCLHGENIRGKYVSRLSLQMLFLVIIVTESRRSDFFWQHQE